MIRPTILGVVFLVVISWPLPAQDKTKTPAAADELRTLNHYFPFTPPKTLREWETRRKRLKQDLQVHLGLWPMPVKTPLRAIVHGKIDMGKYTVEKVYFQSFPGFYVTGNLYRPKNAQGKKCPAILSPHGHWSNGRFLWASDAEVKRQIAAGGEKFESNARSPLQARCANLAIKGCVVFHYDMIGYADSTQISHGIAHGFRKQRADMNQPDAFGFFSPQAELRLQSIMGLQTWNSIRSLDFLCSLPDVDSKRIGVTGASGGGTQTFILCAIDPRPAAAFPAVMVSTAMQGGCTCENCCNLRVNTGNVEIAALFAPKPMALTAANDWTKAMQQKGFPELQQLYELYQQKNNVSLFSKINFGHNFNQQSREALYRFLKQYKILPKNADTTEQEIVCLKREKLTVFDEKHNPFRARGNEIEFKILRHWTADFNKQLSGIALYSDQQRRRRAMILPALQSIVLHQNEPLEFKKSNAKFDKLTADWSVGTLVGKQTGILCDVLFRKKLDSTKRGRKFEIFLGADGSATQFEKSPGKLGEITPHRKTTENIAVMINWRDDGNNRLVPNGREAAGYTFGYNRCNLAIRVSKILNVIRYIRATEKEAQISLIADADSAPIAVLANSLLDFQLSGLAIDCKNISFFNIKKLTSPRFLPGAIKYGGSTQWLLLHPPKSTILVNADEQMLKEIKTFYKRNPQYKFDAQIP